MDTSLRRFFTPALLVLASAIFAVSFASVNADGGGWVGGPICGNTLIESPETCDDGNMMNGDGCSAVCDVESGGGGGGGPICGNAVIESPETCDDGNMMNGDGCSAVCDVESGGGGGGGPICGNAVIESPETCDDGNVVNGDGCSSSCVVETMGGGSTCSPDGTVVGQTPMTYQNVVLQDDARCCSGASVYGGQYGRDIVCRDGAWWNMSEPWVDMGCGAVMHSYNITCNPTQEHVDITCADGEMLQGRSVYDCNIGPNWRNFRDERRCVPNPSCIVPPPQPDLSAGTASYTAQGPTPYVYAGQGFSYLATVTNAGGGNATTFPNLFQIVTSDYTTTTALIGATSLSLAAGQSSGITGMGSVASAGFYNVRACADSSSGPGLGGAQQETNENNNCGPWTSLAVTPSAPNGLSASCAQSGSSVILSWSASAGSSGYYVRVQKPTSQSCPSGWQPAGWDPTNVCVPNPDWVNGTSVSFPTTPGTAYSWWVHGALSGGEWGPGASGGFTCTAGVDLSTSISSPTSATAGTSVTLSATVSNTGPGSAPASLTSSWVRNNSGTVIYNNDINTASIASGGQVVVSQNYTFSAAGTYTVRFCADNTTTWVGSISETNEGNNCGPWQTVTVSAPSPTVTLSSSPSSVPSGSASTLSWSSTNATSCTGSGFSTGGATAGSVGTGPLSATTNYQISCGGAVDTETVFVTFPHVDLSATPDRVRAGQSTTLSWSSTDVTACTVTGTNGFSGTGTSGSASSGPISRQSIFSVSCNGGVATDSVIVNIIPSFEEF